MLATLRDVAAAGGWVLGAIVALSTLAWVLVVRKGLELAAAGRLVDDVQAAGAGGARLEASLSELLVAVHVHGHRMATKVLAPLMEAARVHFERHLSLIAGLAVVLPLLVLGGLYQRQRRGWAGTKEALRQRDMLSEADGVDGP